MQGGTLLFLYGSRLAVWSTFSKRMTMMRVRLGVFLWFHLALQLNSAWAQLSG